MSKGFWAALASASFVAVGASWAQPYPTRAITLIVPYGAGGPLDTLTRIVSERMRVSLGQPIVIDNITGASGIIDVNEFRQILRRQCGSRHNQIRIARQQSDRLEVAQQIVLQRKYRPVDDVSWPVSDADRIAIRLRSCSATNADNAGCARYVVDHDRLAE